MNPFHNDPRWYEERWYDDPPEESETGPPPRLRSGRLGRVAVCLALVAALRR